MAAGDDQKNVYLWKLSNNLPKMVLEISIILKVLSGHATGVSELSFCSRADYIFSGTIGGTVHMWDIAKRSDTVKMLGH
jgi:WD40 repeat protein